jgi:hypothetical protein
MLLDWLCSIFVLNIICSPSLVNGLKFKDLKRLGVETSSLRVIDVGVGILGLGMGMPFIIL